MAQAISYQQIMEELAKPLDLKDIEWRVQSAVAKNGGGYRLLVLPYVTSRAIMNRLDKVVGAFWKDQYQPIGQSTAGFRCILSLKIGDEWVSREDAAELTDIEPIKGGYSNALKRAGAKWGIGRYLYRLPQYWVDVKERGEHYVGGNFTVNQKSTYIRGYYDTPKLPKEALPETTPNNRQPSRQQQQRQQAPNNSNQSQNSAKSNDEAERQAKSLNLVKGQLQYLGIPLNLVPQLLEQASGSKVPYELATKEDLGKLYRLLKPSQVYVQACVEMGSRKPEDILYFANITLAPQLKKKLESVYELVFHMTAELSEQALVLVREAANNIQQQVS